ncbi:hypothetical protein AK812_SmicGene4407 [Symbiodinium microadriaticum]|uniref:PDZ domain-containing protein n=1 Tax=Symbiodinium microadriaticum TaxID=2951 RepID=A0A1Q9EWA0_SYMMI|nr:hypothetical protein AK812_SmicGene4407 [Symbiodinium microadriaticum]
MKLQQESFHEKISDMSIKSYLAPNLKADTGVLTVSGVVQPGAVAEWNDRCPPGQDIRLYDRVLRVNGKAGSAMDLLAALREEVDELEVLMERPRIREVEVRKEGRELGLVLFVSTANRLHSGLVVSMVKEGALVSDIKPHDRIIEVNGQVLPPSELLEGVRGEQLTMKICCYRAAVLMVLVPVLVPLPLPVLVLVLAEGALAARLTQDTDGSSVHSVTFSAEGEMIVVACADRSIKVWSLSTSEQLTSLNGHENYLEKLQLYIFGAGASDVAGAMRFFSLLLTMGLPLSHAATNEEWGHTINIAGLQRTLSQVMSKEFVLVSLGIDSDANKAKLQETMQNFNTTLHALVSGDPARGIVGAPNQQVGSGGDFLRRSPFEELLRQNVDSVRFSDGSANRPVLEAVSAQNVKLLAASGVVVSGLVDAAKVAGASTNGLVQDIAGRQRSFIQSICLQSLLIGQGILLTRNKAALKETKLMFEASHHGIIEGVPFAGLPVLTSMCTLHQMSEVTYYYSSFRPMINEILNAHTAESSQETARRLAPQIADLTEPLFQAMVEAVELFNEASQACEPMSSMTDSDWRSFLTTLGRLRLQTQQISQYFMQVALGSHVHTSKVEITVGMSAAAQLLRSLLEGRKAEGIPSPPTQDVVDQLLTSSEAWTALATELTSATHAEVVTPIMVDRVALLSEDVLKELSKVMDTTVQAAVVSSPSAPSHLLDLTSQQAMLISKLSKEASLIRYGIQVDEHWEALNASRDLFVATHQKLLLGSPATNTTPALRELSEVCIIWRMREVEDLYSQLQDAAVSVATGSTADMDKLHRLSQPALAAMASATDALVKGVCENSTNPTRPRDKGRGALGLRTVISTVRPAVASFQEASAGMDVLTVVDAAASVFAASEALRQKYLNGAMEANPNWPGARVGVAVKQVTQASRIHKEALLSLYGLRTGAVDLQNAIEEFEAAHHQLKDGGGEIAAIIPERQDLLLQWQHVDAAWVVMREEARKVKTEDSSIWA